MHVLQPNQYVPGSKLLTETEKRIAYRSDDEYSAFNDMIRKGYEAIAREIPELQARGVHIIDGRMLFADVTSDIFIDTMGHINDDGAQIVLEAIVSYLASHGVPRDVPD